MVWLMAIHWKLGYCIKSDFIIVSHQLGEYLQMLTETDTLKPNNQLKGTHTTIEIEKTVLNSIGKKKKVQNLVLKKLDLILLSRTF